MARAAGRQCAEENAGDVAPRESRQGQDAAGDASRVKEAPRATWKHEHGERSVMGEHVLGLRQNSQPGAEVRNISNAEMGPVCRSLTASTSARTTGVGVRAQQPEGLALFPAQSAGVREPVDPLLERRPPLRRGVAPRGRTPRRAAGWPSLRHTAGSEGPGAPPAPFPCSVQETTLQGAAWSSSHGPDDLGARPRRTWRTGSP